MAASFSPKSFNQKLADWVRRVLACCDTDHNSSDTRPTLQIGYPTNFRREDISIPGLTEPQQRFLREKAAVDADLMYHSLHPLRSNPTSTNDLVPPGSRTCSRPGSRNASQNNLHRYTHIYHHSQVPTYDVEGRPYRDNPSRVSLPMPPPPQQRQGRLDRIKRHSRNISDSLTKQHHHHSPTRASHRYQPVHSGSEQSNLLEMQSGEGAREVKLDDESDFLSSEEDKDSALGGLGRK